MYHCFVADTGCSSFPVALRLGHLHLHCQLHQLPNLYLYKTKTTLNFSTSTTITQGNAMAVGHALTQHLLYTTCWSMGIHVI